jgi:alpha-L-fucosidase 2
MKKVLLFFILGISAINVVNARNDSLQRLWFNRPAEKWVEALPLGNGRLGAMVFGNPYRERIQLNEITVWGGAPYRNDNPDALMALPEVRKLIFEGKYKEAQDLANEKIITKVANGMPYQPVGNLYLSFPGHENFSEFYRELDIEKAVSTTSYKVGKITYKREIFSSFPDQVIVMRITADQQGKINFAVSMDRPSPVEISTENNDILVMQGITGDCESVKGQVKFCTLVKVVPHEGTISAAGNALFVNGANSALIYISIASGFKNYNDISNNPVEKATSYLESAIKKDFNNALAEHIAAYQKYFNRVKLDLGQTDSVKKPTDVRIEQFSKGNDPQLAALYFQYGRYLLICSSQPGGQPSTLQGIWNDQLYPPWDSKYTVNINTEMNYWPSEVTNLSEMNEPLIQMIRELSETGRQTAKVMYGAQGWVLHHNTDIWRINGPVDGSFWGMWPMGGAWLCQHLWEKYEYNGNAGYLNSVYPVLKGAAEFYLSFLVEEPNHKWLVVCPSVSPENSPQSHPESSISAGTTMDNQLLFDLFTNTINAAEILKTDKEFVVRMKETLKRLPPMQIGQYGQLQEWMEDWDNPNDHHRHVSHLYGVFPSNQISPYRTPELFDAARTSLIYRGDPSTGWSMNWKINLWARFQDGNHAYKLICDQIKLVGRNNNTRGSFSEDGGTYPNMFDAHPPFQIDGNFGFTSGIAEMIMQCYDGNIDLLPAMPDIWKSGSVSGLRAKGGFEILSLNWKEGKITDLVIKSNLGGNCRIRVYNTIKAADKTRLLTAKGTNPNTYYKVPDIKAPLISGKAKLHKITMKESHLYDFETKEETIYTFKGE